MILSIELDDGSTSPWRRKGRDLEFPGWGYPDEGPLGPQDAKKTSFPGHRRNERPAHRPVSTKRRFFIDDSKGVKGSSRTRRTVVDRQRSGLAHSRETALGARRLRETGKSANRSHRKD